MKKAGPLRIGLLTATLFRSSIRSGGFKWSAGSMEEMPEFRNIEKVYYNHQKIKAAWLESERKKAETVIWSRRIII